jgi:HlyD family secretion protein
MSSKKIIIGVAILASVGGLAGVAMAKRGPTGAVVRTEVVSRRDLVSVVTASGKIEPKRKVDISADIPGRVTQVAVEEGQWVDRGALLIRIDPSQYQSAVRQAEAAVAQARAREAQARAQLLKAQNDARRAEMLSQGKDQLISAQDLDQARTQGNVAGAELQAARFAVAQAQAALSEARTSLSKTTIVAPMSGRVTRLNIEEGETAVVGTMNNPGSLLLTVADLSVMEAKIKVDETEVPNVTIGDSAAVRIDAFPDQSFSGRVTRIGNSAVQTAAGQAGASDQQSVDFEVVITLDSPPATLRPDLSATADVVTESRRNVLSVPIIALTVRDREGKKFSQDSDSDGDAEQPAAQVEAANRSRRDNEVMGVFVMRDGKADWVPVEIGIAGDRYFEIRKGLRGGETVVSGSYQAVRELQDDDAVRVETPKEGEPAKAKGAK